MSAALRIARSARLVCDGILPNEISIARQHAAKVLRPWTIDRAVDDHVTDLPGAQFLRFGRSAEKCVDLSLDKKVHRVDRRGQNPVDILRVEPHVGGHAGDQHMRGQAPGLRAYLASF